MRLLCCKLSYPTCTQYQAFLPSVTKLSYCAPAVTVEELGNQVMVVNPRRACAALADQVEYGRNTRMRLIVPYKARRLGVGLGLGLGLGLGPGLELGVTCSCRIFHLIREGYSTWSVSPSVCLLPRFLPLRATRRPKSDNNRFSATLA